MDCVCVVVGVFAWYGIAWEWGFDLRAFTEGMGDFWLRSECHIDGLVEC
jgi:hypothetical protein